MKTRILVIASILALFALPVLAGGDKMSKETFNRIDVNHDGKITRGEAQAYAPLAETWQQYDENKNGALEQAEFSRFEEESPASKDMKK